MSEENKEIENTPTPSPEAPEEIKEGDAVISEENKEYGGETEAPIPLEKESGQMEPAPVPPTDISEETKEDEIFQEKGEKDLEEEKPPGFFQKINDSIEDFTQKVKIQSKINFARNLAIAVKSGSSLVKGLQMVQRQSDSKPLKRIIDKVITDVNNGQFLAQSLSQYERLFGSFFINIIKIGEASGALSENLLYLSDELKKQKEIRSKVRSAMIYPMIVFVLAIIIAAFLVFFILPQLLPVLSDLGVELPPTTRFLIWVVDAAQAYGLYIFLGFIGLMVGLKFLMMVSSVRLASNWLLLHIPIISGIVRNLTLTTFSRALALLLKSGMPIVEALEVSTGTVRNVVYKREIKRIANRVRKGEPITKHMEFAGEKLFPIMFVSIIEVGEQTGSLEENLFYLSDYYEDETSETLDNLSTTIEPILLLFMGLLVGFIAISIIVPIYQITQGTIN